jgi:hypothetical protein
MKLFLALLFATLCAATGYGQTMKALSYNTNGVVAYSSTNALRFTNEVRFGGGDLQIDSVGRIYWSGDPRYEPETQTFYEQIQFDSPTTASNTRVNLGATVLGNAIFTAANQTAARQALGLQSYTNTFTNSVGTLEIGSTLGVVTIGWTIAPTNATYALRQIVRVPSNATNVLSANSGTITVTPGETNDTTWTLTVGDGQGITNTVTTSVLFQNYMIWGRSTNTALNNTDLQSLHTSGGGASRAFATSRSRSITMDGGAQYLFIAYPQGFGAASFTVGGLPNSAWTVATNGYTNASGYATNYLIYRTDTIQNGTGINIVVQ